MSKIMRNGKKYGGTASSMAKDIIYDGTESGLESTDAQGAIDELQEQVSELNSNLGGLEFAQDENGNWGYRIVGADSVTPFLSLEDRTPNLIGNKDTASFSAEIGAKYLITVGGMINTTSWNYSVSGATKLINTDLVYGTKNAGLYPVLQSFIVEATSTTVKVPCGVYACISWFKIS